MDGTTKINLIKELRALAENGHNARINHNGNFGSPAIIGLKEAKDFVEKVAAEAGPGGTTEVDRLNRQIKDIETMNDQSFAVLHRAHAVEVSRLEGQVDALESIIRQLLDRLSN